MRESELEKIIKTENLLQEGVDPRKIFSSLQGELEKDNFDHYTVYLPGVGYNWIVGTDGNYRLLSRDIWYTSAGLFKNNRCIVGIDGDKNWIDERGEIIRPDDWLEGTRGFNDLGIAIGKRNGKFSWFDSTGKQLSEEWYESIRNLMADLTLYTIHEWNKGYNLSKSDGVPLLSSWYWNILQVQTQERVVIVNRLDRNQDKLEYCLLDLKNGGKELCDWYDYIEDFGPFGWAVVISDDKGINFINTEGKLVDSNKWYTKVDPFIVEKGRFIIPGVEIRVDSCGKVIEEKFKPTI
jgi:hypothetical protein